MSLTVGEHPEQADLFIGIPHDFMQKPFKVAEHPLDRRCLEHSRCTRARLTAFVFYPYRQRQVEFRRDFFPPPLLRLIPGISSVSRGAFCITIITWNSGE